MCIGRGGLAGRAALSNEMQVLKPELGLVHLKWSELWAYEESTEYPDMMLRHLDEDESTICSKK